MLFAADHATQVANSAYLWIYIIIGVPTLIGFGYGAIKWVRQGGADAERLEARLKSIERNLKPNGLDTDQVGDIVKRTEDAVTALGSKLDQHIGAELQARKEMWREIRRKKEEL